MDNAGLYANGNNLQKKDAEDVMLEYFHLMNFSKNGAEKIIDIGCGEGRVTMEVLLPRLPKNIDLLLGTDVSSKMIKFAEATYGNENAIDFEVLDISAKLNNKYTSQFDHLFSFNCLHWVQNQRAAMKNIYNILKDNGECLLCFQARNLIFDVYEMMSEIPLWSPYMKDYKAYISPYHYSKDPTLECHTLMEGIGFRNVKVETKQRMFYFYGLKPLKEAVFGVSPFLNKIPSNLHEQYFEDYVQQLKRLDLMDEGNNNTGDEVIIRSPYLSTVCYAVK